MDDERYELLVKGAVMVRSLARLGCSGLRRELMVEELQQIAAVAEEILEVLEGSERGDK